jgi:methylphosphotriester-DNA--protein-cysteine methyltransferase
MNTIAIVASLFGRMAEVPASLIRLGKARLGLTDEEMIQIIRARAMHTSLARLSEAIRRNGIVPKSGIVS